MAVLDELQKPFFETEIEWRVQRAMNTKRGAKAIVVPYVQNRAIQNRLDDLFGVSGWRNEYKEIHDGIMCGISIKFDDEWITKWDGADITNIEPTKGGLSNSMKRAAVQWGIGRYLYTLKEQWVDIKERGDMYNKEPEGYWDIPRLPAYALPDQVSISTIKAKWQALAGDLNEFDEFYEKQTQKGHNNDDIDRFLTEKLKEKGAKAS